MEVCTAIPKQVFTAFFAIYAARLLQTNVRKSSSAKRNLATHVP